MTDEYANSLCANPDCFNVHRDCFTVTTVVSGDVNASFVICDVCNTENDFDRWEIALQRLENEIRSNPNPESESREDPTDTETSFDGGSVAHVSSTFSCASLSELMITTRCLQCQKPYTPVPGESRDPDPLAYYCDTCEYYTGVDDTYSEEDANMLVNTLLTSLEEGTIRSNQCPGGCGNDDVNQFKIDIQQGRLVLRCMTCSYSQQLHGDCDDGEAADAGIDDAERMIQCDCGNVNPELFAMLYDDDGRPHKITCHRCQRSIIIDGGTPYNEGDDVPLYGEGDDVRPPKGRTEVEHLGQLHPGDHISWDQPLAYWHHAIVVRISSIGRKIKVIHYNGPMKRYGGKGEIAEEWIDTDCAKESIYRQDYDGCHRVETVIRRARSRLGEIKYNLFTNNCEHFAQWCKTGVPRSGQVESFGTFLGHSVGRLSALTSKDGIKQGINIARGIWKTASRVSKVQKLATGVKGLGQVAFTATVGKEGVEAVGKASMSMAQRQASEVASSIGKLDYIAIGLVVAIEGYRTYSDLSQAHRQMKKGDISKAEFKRVSIKRVTQGVCGTVGTVGGGLIGQVLIPIPVVGGLVGSTLGALLGEGLGALTGRWLVKKSDGK